MTEGFKQWLENINDLESLIQKVLQDSDDMDLLSILGDAFEENGMADEAYCMHNAEKEIFYLTKTNVWYDEEGEYLSHDDVSDFFDWESTIKQVSEMVHASQYPITRQNAGTTWLSSETEWNHLSGHRHECSLHIKSHNKQNLPNIIMWMILKIGGIRGVK